MQTTHNPAFGGFGAWPALVGPKVDLEYSAATSFNNPMSKHDPSPALQELTQGGGFLYPFLHGYERLAAILDALPPDEWRRDETVLAGLVLHLLKRGQSLLAKSYFHATNLEFEKTYQFDMLDLLLALHLGEPVSEEKLTSWRRLERALPISNALLSGLYYNTMMAMHVRLLRLDDARVAAQQAISCFREAGHIYLEHFIHIHLADMDVIEGRLRRAMRGLRTAERCLEMSHVRYGNEVEVIAIIRLAIDYERGHLDRVRRASAKLRNSLMTGDSWSELFFQLARISVMSAYFLDGRQAAQVELETFQADYARRHNGAPYAIDLLEARLSHLEWQPNVAERQLSVLDGTPIHSTIGQGIKDELRASLGMVNHLPQPTPKGAIVAALQQAQSNRGKSRKQAIECALRLALEEGQIAPFLEHRDVFLGADSKPSSDQFLRGNIPLTRLVKRVMHQVHKSYVIPDELRALGFNRRQYRVAAALQAGSTHKQVARQLGTSEATVKYHLTAIYKMAGVFKKGQLIDFMNSLGVFQNS